MVVFVRSVGGWGWGASDEELLLATALVYNTKELEFLGLPSSPLPSYKPSASTTQTNNKRPIQSWSPRPLSIQNLLPNG